MAPERETTDDTGEMWECSCSICSGAPELHPCFPGNGEERDPAWDRAQPGWDCADGGQKSGETDEFDPLAALAVLIAAEEGVFWPGGDDVFYPPDLEDDPSGGDPCDEDWGSY